VLQNAGSLFPAKATVVEIQAAKTFQDYIERISGAMLSIETDNTNPQKGDVLIGNVSRPELSGVSKEKLGKDGVLIKNTGNSLVITGGNRQGSFVWCIHFS
jgi:hypothetical protein